MAGGILQANSKTKAQIAKNNSFLGLESLSESKPNRPTPPPAVQSPESRPKLSFSGLLFSRTEVAHTKTEKKPWSSEFIPTQSILGQEKVLLDTQKQALKREIEQIHQEIQAIASSTKELSQDIAIAALSPPTEVNTYQVNFLSRIKILLQHLRKNISTADSWFQEFSGKKKKKKNFFWGQVKNKKGGQQYLESGEHSAARAVT